MPRHHLVPRLLLRGFADDDDLVTLAERDAPHRAFGAAVSRACTEIGFYEIPAADVDLPDTGGHDPEVMERALGEVESPAAPVVRGLREGRLPAVAGQRSALALLAAVQITRGWRYREHVAALVNAQVRLEAQRPSAIDGVVRRLLESGEAADEAGARVRAREVLSSAWTVRPHKSVLIQEGLRHALEVAAPHLETRRLLLMRFARPTLLTSDAAVAAWSPPEVSDVLPGFADANKVLMPLDRRTCLAFAGDGRDAVVRCKAHQATRINRALAGEASRWVVHHPADRPLDGLKVPPKAQLVWRSVRTEPAGRGLEREVGAFVFVPTPGPGDRPANVADGRPLHSYRTLEPGLWPR